MNKNGQWATNPISWNYVEGRCISVYFNMFDRIDLAWRILQVVALGLPAVGILFQVLVHLDNEKYDSRPHHYHISNSMLFLILPMAGAGVISSLVISLTVDVLWVQVAVSCLGLSFIFIPVVLVSAHRRTRRRSDEFLEEEKENILRDYKKGEIDEEAIDEIVDDIERAEGSAIENLGKFSDDMNDFFDSHPLVFVLIYGSMLAIGTGLLIRGGDTFSFLAAGWLILYSSMEIGLRYIPWERYIEDE